MSQEPPSVGRAGVAIDTRTEAIQDDDDTSNLDRWHIGVPYRTRRWHLVPAASD